MLSLKIVSLLLIILQSMKQARIGKNISHFIHLYAVPSHTSHTHAHTHTHTHTQNTAFYLWKIGFNQAKNYTLKTF